MFRKDFSIGNIISYPCQETVTNFHPNHIKVQLDALCQDQDTINILKRKCPIHRLRNGFFAEEKSLYDYVLELQQSNDAAAMEKAQSIVFHIGNEEWNKVVEVLAVTRNWFDPLTETTGSKIMRALIETGTITEDTISNNVKYI